MFKRGKLYRVTRDFYSNSALFHFDATEEQLQNFEAANSLSGFSRMYANLNDSTEDFLFYQGEILMFVEAANKGVLCKGIYEGFSFIRDEKVVYIYLPVNLKELKTLLQEVDIEFSDLKDGV